jgi:hypothetical protein
MDQVLSSLRDYAAIVVACIAAAVSIVTLVLTTRLTEGRERRKVLWERELSRFSELEDVAGRLVEDLMRFNIREDAQRAEAFEKLQFLRTASGRFLRYDSIASALRDLENAAGWYISQDMKHENRAEYEKSRSNVNDSFKKLVRACDETLRKAPRAL